MTHRLRVLFLAEAVTLAHVARCAALTRLLDPDRFDVRTAWDSRYDHLVGAADTTLWTIPARQFARALYRGTPIYRDTDLLRYVRDDLATIERFQPDVVVGDFRLSLDVSARLAGVRYIAITNAYWSPHATVYPPVPDTALTAIAGVRLGQHLFDAGTSAVAAWHAHAFGRLRRNYGLAPTTRDIRQVYTQGDTTLYADLPQLVPMPYLPEDHGFLGPVAWSPDVELPDWWGGLPSDRPLVYVSLGSSGRGGLLPVIVDTLARLPVTVVVSTAGSPSPERRPANVHVAQVLPGHRDAGHRGLRQSRPVSEHDARRRVRGGCPVAIGTAARSTGAPGGATGARRAADARAGPGTGPDHRWIPHRGTVPGSGREHVRRAGTATLTPDRGSVAVEPG